MKFHALISFIRAKYTNLPHHQKPMVKLFAGLIVIIALMILVKGCHTFIANKHTKPPEPIVIRQDNKLIIPENSPLRAQIQVKTVKLAALPHVVSFPGVVEADPSRTVNILPPLIGRLISLKVSLGEKVKRGQLLAVIRSSDLAQASSDNDKALSILKLTEEALKRARGVNRAGANSIKDIEQAQNNYTQASAEVERTKARLKALGKNGYTLLNIRSPIEGTINALNYGVGSYINDSTAPLMTIADISQVWITAFIPENLAGVVSKGLPAVITLPAYPQETLKGKVTFVSAFLEPGLRRNKTRIAFDNPKAKLQPNMYAKVKIAFSEPDQIIIPISAILMNNDTTSVFVEESPWTFIRHEIELGIEDGENVRVLAGLKPGDRVVISGGVMVND